MTAAHTLFLRAIFMSVMTLKFFRVVVVLVNNSFYFTWNACLLECNSDKPQSKIEITLVNKDLHLAFGNGPKFRTMHYLRKSIFPIETNNLRPKKLKFCANQTRCGKANSNAPSYGICHIEYTRIKSFPCA